MHLGLLRWLTCVAAIGSLAGCGGSDNSATKTVDYSHDRSSNDVSNPYGYEEEVASDLRRGAPDDSWVPFADSVKCNYSTGTAGVYNCETYFGGGTSNGFFEKYVVAFDGLKITAVVSSCWNPDHPGRDDQTFPGTMGPC